MKNAVGRVCEYLLDVFFPQSCLGCEVVVPSALGFCADCGTKLEQNPCHDLGELPLYAPYRYCGPLTTAIHRLKYEDRSEYAARLVESSFSSRLPAEFDGAVLVPVPLHPIRLIERGYNQSGLLAVALAKRWKLRDRHDWLVRQSFVTRQVGLGREARVENTKNAFAIEPTAPLEGKRIVLVDDVVTTGSTVSSCQSVLVAGGATVVGVVAMARAESRATVHFESSSAVRVRNGAGVASFGVGL
jgi:ComF family protein